MSWLADVHWNLVAVLIGLAGAVAWGMWRSRAVGPPRRRRIAGLDAMEDAIGRATELGRPVLYVAGSQDLDNIQTVASLGMLGAVGRMTARHGCELAMPTARSLVLSTGREVLRESYTAAGRPDDYVPDMVSYVSDDQFGFAARVDGMIVRRRPAAIFLQGAFGAESLLLAEAGAQTGAVQVAGTAMNHQLPFLVAACDHVLIGEEFFAAEAYLSGDVERLGALRGQDLVKDVTIGMIVVGTVLVTLAAVLPWPWLAAVRNGLLALLHS
jgi:hypothetical protein